MMWARIKDAIETGGGQIQLHSEVVGLKLENKAIASEPASNGLL